MKINTKNIVMCLILAVIIVLSVFAVNYSKKQGEISKNDNNVIESVTNRNDFFNIGDVVNTYFSNVAKNNINNVIKTLDQNYVIENEITEKNIKKFVNYTYDEIFFYPRNIYVKTYKSNKYYFIKGEIQGYNFSNQVLEEKENVNILVNMDTYNKVYSITPLSLQTTIQDYAKNYEINPDYKITNNSINRYTEKTFSNEFVLRYYINYFNNILYLNSKKAYEMLSPRYKKTFNNYNSFVNKISNIDKEINMEFYSYNYSNDEENNIYTIDTMNFKKIEIIEESPMNFKIDISDSPM